LKEDFMTLWVSGIIILLIAVNAFYVAAEFAAVGARRSRIRSLAQRGNVWAARILPILDDARKLDRYIACCQIGITLSSLIVGAYSQANVATHLAPLFQQWGELQPLAAQSAATFVVLFALGAAQMVFGELVPKSLALQYPTQAALYTVLPMEWSLACFSWFVVVLNRSSATVLRLLRMRQVGPRHIHSPEEIELLIAESRDGGLLEPDEHRRLRRALRLGVCPANRFMVPRTQITGIDIEAPIEKVLQQVATRPYTRLPVYRHSIDNIVGVLHMKDLAKGQLQGGGIRSIEPLIRPIPFMPENIMADRLLANLRESRSHQAILQDEFGGVAGLVTLRDVLEEVLGEVGDELQTVQPQPERLVDGRVRLPGGMRLADVEPWIGTLSQGESHTISGRVIESLGHLPTVGERITISGVEIEIEKVRNRTIASVLAKPSVHSESA
jgi:CBS domain containing-hemolysin-like protein